EGAEDLVRLAAEPAVVADLGVLVVAGGQHDVELAVRVGDPPGLQGRVPVVVPRQLPADLGEAPVQEEPVLGGPGALGPLGAELQADHVSPGPPGAAAPVPPDGRGPAAPPDVEHAPRVAGLPADVPAPVA